VKQRYLMIVLTLSLAVNAATLATVGYHYWRNTCITSSAPCPLNPSDRHLYESLGLSSEQTARMAVLAQSFHRRMGELDSAVGAKRNLLIDLLGEERPDPVRTEAVRKEIAGLQDEIQKEVITHITVAKKEMNTDQRRRFIELLRLSSNNNGRANSPLSMNGGNR